MIEFPSSINLMKRNRILHSSTDIFVLELDKLFISFATSFKIIVVCGNILITLPSQRYKTTKVSKSLLDA